MKQIEVSILGQAYILGCPEGSEAQLQAAVEAVDREMTAIRDAGKVKARERIAVLAALNMAFLLNEQGSRSAPAAPTGAGAATPAEDAATGVDLDRLLQQLDEALDQDGQLI